MRSRITSLFALAALAPLGLAQQGSHVRPDLDGAMNSWRTVHGWNWSHSTDLETGYAQMVYGGHTEGPASLPRQDADFVALAQAAIAPTAGLHGLEPATLVFHETHFLPLGQVGSGDKQTVNFRQQVGGLDVEGGYLNLLFSSRGELLSIQSTGLPLAGSIGTVPGIDAGDAAAFARSHFGALTGVEANDSSVPVLLVAQIVENGRRVGHLAWKVECSWNPADGEPVAKRVYVDAQSGALLRADEMIHHFEVRGNVSAMASPGTLPDIASNPETAQLTKNLRCTAGATTVYTDANGHFSFPALNSTTSVTFNFIGNYASVNYSPGADYSLSQSLPANVDNTVTMNPTSSATVTPQANAFIVATRMNEWIRSIDAGDSHGNFVTAANVNVSGTCNAYYNGTSINFFPSGGGCVNTAYSTIITHEQGHWMNDRYNTGNGSDGMGEGNADVFAMYMWDNPIVGQNFSGGSYIRTGNNTTQFCGDANPGCHGGVHADGEVWMGAAWKVRNNLNTTLGNTVGDMTANALFLGWLNAYNQTQIKSVIETQWMTLDDDDGNITNGTPHFTPIDNGFRSQGFPGLTVSCPAPMNVCISSTNSTGLEAYMSFSGTNDVSNNNFVLQAFSLPPNKTGLFFFGQNQTLVTFGNGYRCIGSPFYRLPATSSNEFGDIYWALNLGALPGGATIDAGETWYFQCWYRDPPAGGAFYNASDALQVQWCP